MDTSANNWEVAKTNSLEASEEGAQKFCGCPPCLGRALCLPSSGVAECRGRGWGMGGVGCHARRSGWGMVGVTEEGMSEGSATLQLQLQLQLQDFRLEGWIC